MLLSDFNAFYAFLFIWFLLFVLFSDPKLAIYTAELPPPSYVRWPFKGPGVVLANALADAAKFGFI